MGNYAKKLTGKAELESGETMLAGARAMTKGATAAIIAGATAGAVGGVLGAAAVGASGKAGTGREQAEDLGMEYAPQVALGLTNRRLIIWERSPMTGGPTEIIGEILLDRIKNISGGDSGGFFKFLKPMALHVQLTDGKTADFEIVRIDGYKPIVEAFRELRGKI